MNTVNIIKTRAGTYVPGLGIVSIPTHITRRNNPGAWVICYRNYPSIARHLYLDRDYRTCGAALKAAIKALEKHEKALTIGRRLLEHEMAHKREKIDLVGVCHIRRYKRGYWQHYFAINNPLTYQQHAIYIGTDVTWKANWPEKYKLAAELRRHLEETYNAHYYWKGLYELPGEAGEESPCEVA